MGGAKKFRSYGSEISLVGHRHVKLKQKQRKTNLKSYFKIRLSGK